MEKNYVKINLYNFCSTFATHLLYCMYAIVIKIISYEEDVMKKTLKYSVMAFITALLFVVASACTNNNGAASAQASDNAVVKASYDRGALAASKADFTLAAEKVKSQTGKTDKATCFSCHEGVSELHTRGAHKDLDCTNCHFDITAEHTETPTPENRPKVNMNWEACGQCHDNQMHSFLEVGKHRPARFEKSNFNGRSPNPAWDKLMAPYGFTKEHAATRSHSLMLIDQFVVDRAFGGQFQPKNGWNYIFEAGPVWDVLYDAKEKDPNFKDLPQTARAVNPVCMNCKTMDHMLDWAYLGEPNPKAKWSRLSNPVEMAKNMNHALNCFFCHDPHSAEPRIVRDALIEAMTSEADYAKNNLYQTDANKVKAEVRVITTRSMFADENEPKMIRKIAILPKDDPRRQSLQCAQCHVEYNCAAGTDTVTGAKIGFDDPRTNHFPLKNALALYDHYFVNLKFGDFKNKFSGAMLWKGQHPEFETYYNSIHDKAGVSCVQCHMETVEKGGKLEYTSHFVQSPRYILDATCLTSDCHGTGADKHANWQGKDADYVKVSTNWTAEDAKYSIDSIKTYTTGRMRKAEFWLAQLIDTIALAERLGVDKATLDAARTQHTKAHILWEYWTAENSDGFHNPALARESLTQSINESMKGYDMLDAAMKKLAAK